MLAEDPAGMERALAKLLLFPRLALASSRLCPSCRQLPWSGSVQVTVGPPGFQRCVQ